MKMVPFSMLTYVEDKDAYMTEDEIPEGARTLSISGTDLRDRLAKGREIPGWFTFPEVARELRKTYPPRHRQGFTIFFTGLCTRKGCFPSSSPASPVEASEAKTPWIFSA